MKSEQTTFDVLINPISKSDFITKYWEKEFLHIPRNDIQYYSGILTIAQMNDFLSHNDIRYPTIRLAKNGAEVPLGDYSNILTFGNYAAEGLINIDKLFNCYYDGATIVHQLMKYSVDSLSQFTNDLEKHFGFTVETTVYLTPEKSQGFTAHYDTHSVFVLQIYGSKTWRLYDNVKDLPTLDQHFVKALYKETEPKNTIKLLPGDLLYVPRGLAHDAITTDGVSLHITLGVFPHLWLDYFTAGLQHLKNQVEFRKAPLDYILDNDKWQEEKFNQLLDTFLSGLNETVLLQTLSEKVISRQMKDGTERLLNYARRKFVNAESVLSRRKKITFKLTQDNESVRLTFYNKVLDFPSDYIDAIKFIVSNDNFKPKDIIGLQEESDKLKLANKLLEEGFITIIHI